MLRYIVKSKKNIDRLNDDDLLKEILKLRGVEDVEEFLHLTPSVLNDATMFRGMKQAIDMFHKHMIHDSNIHIIMD